MTGSSVERQALWAQVLEIYAVPDVAQACLLLQDRFGVDVMLILFSLALGRCERQPLDLVETAQADTLIANWRASVIQPLRGVRRTLKGGIDQIPLPLSDPIRDVIKRTELAAEEIEFDALVAHHAERRQLSAGRGWAVPAIEAVLAHFGGMRAADPDAECADAVALIAEAAERA